MGNILNLDKQASMVELSDRHRRTWESGEIESQPTSKVLFENRICLSISETAYALGISQKSVERLVKRGTLRSKRVGRRVLIPRGDIEAWLHQE